MRTKAGKLLFLILCCSIIIFCVLSFAFFKKTVLFQCEVDVGADRPNLSYAVTQTRHDLWFSMGEAGHAPTLCTSLLDELGDRGISEHSILNHIVLMTPYQTYFGGTATTCVMFAMLSPESSSNIPDTPDGTSINVTLNGTEYLLSVFSLPQSQVNIWLQTADEAAIVPILLSAPISSHKAPAPSE